MKRPRTSFNVVTKGPVASAGSILYLSNISGISVPKIAAKIITANSDMLTVRANSIPLLNKILYPNITTEQISPLIMATENSFDSLALLEI